MKLLSYDRLTTRLVVTVGVGLLLFSAIAGVLTYRYSYRHELELAESLQKQLVRTVRDQAEVAAFADNFEIAQGVLDGLVANPFVLAARIESKGLNVAVGFRESINPGTSTTYRLLSPVDHSEPVGTLVVLQHDEYVIGQAERTAAFQTALMLAQVLVAVLIMAAVLRFMMVVPITRLAKTMGSIRPGSSIRLAIDDKHAEDEIGLLSKSANALLEASEAALKDERALRSLLETTGNIAHVGGWQFHLDTRMLTWSEELYRIHERDPAAPISLNDALGHFSAQDRAEITRAARRAVRQGMLFDLELPLRTATGRQIWVRIQGQCKSENAGRKVLYGALQDVTERKKAETDLIAAKQAAEAANIAKSRFLAAASHDLRQPIQAINLFQNVLNRTELNAEQKRISNYLSLSAHSLGELLDALLDISKLDAGAIMATAQVVDVHDLLRRIGAEFAPIAAAKSLRFKLHFPPDAMAAFTDGALLHGLLRNLVGNALKYTEHGGVLVAIRRRGDQAVVQVWDTGIGIAPEHTEAIFDEYFQVANPERDKAKGLGLGLSIVKRQAKLLATEIFCRSRLGRGSVFEFRLALADVPPQEEPSPIDREAVAAGLGGRHIAVIDDDLMVTKSMQISLESLGMSITTYGSAEEALADSEIASADFYISDFRLPGASGIDLLDAIQRVATRRIKAVLLSGETSPERIAATQAARWPVLFKPVDLPTLLSAIEAQDAMP